MDRQRREAEKKERCVGSQLYEVGTGAKKTT